MCSSCFSTESVSTLGGIFGSALQRGLLSGWIVLVLCLELLRPPLFGCDPDPRRLRLGPEP